MIALQIIDRLEFIHSKNIIHRDIKTDNFVIGRNENNKIIYLIDFGFARKYRSSRTGKHIKFQRMKFLFGHLIFMSINANKGFEQSRRDDLESLGYVLIYLLKGYLPWMGLKAKNKDERFEKILNIKIEISLSSLCKSCPVEFENYLNYVRQLKFDEEPNYENYRDLFLNVMTKKKLNLIMFMIGLLKKK
jgi:serine/threonine protein kinase